MSETKQQCPTEFDKECVRCGVKVRTAWTTCHRCHKPLCSLNCEEWHLEKDACWHDSPVEGSGEPTSSGNDSWGGKPGGSGSTGLKQSLSEEVKGSSPFPAETESFPDSPSAGSGARETLDNLLCLVGEHVSDYGFNGAMYRYHWEDLAKAEQVLHDYADHCTAPLRERLNIVDHTAREMCDVADEERTRREAAERERDAAQATVRLQNESGLKMQMELEVLRAALRGKGESNGN